MVVLAGNSAIEGTDSSRPTNTISRIMSVWAERVELGCSLTLATLNQVAGLAHGLEAGFDELGQLHVVRARRASFGGRGHAGGTRTAGACCTTRRDIDVAWCNVGGRAQRQRDRHPWAQARIAQQQTETSLRLLNLGLEGGLVALEGRYLPLAEAHSHAP